MRYVKSIGLATIAVAVAMAFIGSSTASATEACSVNISPCPAASRWPANGMPRGPYSLKGGWKLVDTEGATLDTCTGANIEPVALSSGSSTTTVTDEAVASKWSYSGCTFTTDMLQGGTLEYHATSGGNGTLTASSELKWTVNTVLFGSCVFGVVKGTSLGSFTGGGKEEAKFVANAAGQRLSGSSVVCPATFKWVAEYPYTGSTKLYLV